MRRVPDPRLCVYCRRNPVEARWRPFCSERCRLQDLGKWLGGDYRIAGEEPPAGPAHPDRDDDD
jgi:endogenous inhibitor of DNA gyrase (YacG/DUF329 family)